MNIKLHTPKSLKAGSGMSSMKQFLLSILATSVSIALTFGTAAIIDHHAKQKSKREIVMMVMYDMYTSLNSIEKADSMIRQSIDVQRQIAEDTTQFNKLRFEMASILLRDGYTETTERIFSSNIETINTVGNVLFTENVAKFYQSRQMYKTEVCDSLYNEVNRDKPLTTVKDALDFQYFFYALMSNDILKDMRHLFALCKQMMEVTDEEIDAYRKEREQMEKDMADDKGVRDSVYNETIQQQKNINELKSKLKLE
ncbi:MAG: hypothetical protein J5529_00305 [Prevotella sp.]|nr:hypothetical protein [Prevotella sp.]